MKRAFTFAEVLIVILIVGVIAALTIPTLVNTLRMKQVEGQLKENYAMFQQAIKLAQAEEVPYQQVASNNLASIKNWFNNYMVPYVKIERICYQSKGCWHARGVVKELNGSTPWYESDVGIGSAIVNFIIAKNAYVNLEASSISTIKSRFGVNVDTTTMEFYIDVNGQTGPNVIGKDIYIMIWTPNGLVPAGNSKSKAEVSNNCLNGNGYWCLQKVINDNWKIDRKVWKR